MMEDLKNSLKPVCLEDLNFNIGLKKQISFRCFLPKGHSGLHACQGSDESGDVLYILFWGDKERWKQREEENR